MQHLLQDFQRVFYHFRTLRITGINFESIAYPAEHFFKNSFEFSSELLMLQRLYFKNDSHC